MDYRYNPLDVGRIFKVGDGERIYGLVMEASIQRGVIHKLSEVAEKLGIVTRYVQFSMPKPGETVAKVIAFLDLTESEVAPEEVLELVRRQDFVKEAEIIKPIRDSS